MNNRQEAEGKIPGWKRDYSLNSGIGWVLLLACWAHHRAWAGSIDANQGFVTIKGLEHEHLQKVHEARLGFEKESNRPPSHGVYEDFRAVMIHMPSLEPEKKKECHQKVLEAAHKAGISVLLITEPGPAKSSPWDGSHDGILFEGWQMENGTSWFPDGRKGDQFGDNGFHILGNYKDGETVTNRAVLMEIGNGGNDGKQEKALKAYAAQVAENPGRWEALAADFKAFPNEFFGALSAYPSECMRRWDHYLENYTVVGVGAAAGEEDISIHGITLDAYEVQFHDLVTHLLAQDLTEPLIREALTNGHACMAHDWLCDPSGFLFGAMNNLGVFSMGDTAPMLGKTRVSAITPAKAKLKLIHKGEILHEVTGTNLTFEVKEPGAYRLEAWLTVDGEGRPWIYSNPVYLRNPGSGDLRMPSMTLSSEVEAQKDIVYLDGPPEDAPKHKLDIYTPKGETNAPVFFFIHGGAWKSGDRSYYPPLGNRYARAGFVTVVPSYRLAPKHPHPAQIEDVAAAFAWTVNHIAAYGGDTNRIYVGGHSAGGHLAALLGLDEKYLASYHLSPTIMRGVLAFSGVYNLAYGESQDSVFGSDSQGRKDASPLFHVHAGAPSFLVSYCQWDYFGLPAQARMFHRALRQAGVPSQLIFTPRQSHISEMVNVTREDDSLVASALSFMK